MAKERNYNWTPRQMARVNARREARGQEALVNKKFSDPDYAKRYMEESDIYSEKLQKRTGALNQAPKTMPLTTGQEEPELSLKERFAQRTEAFKKKFEPTSPIGKPSMMPSTRAIEEEELRRKRGMGAKGISTPTLQGSMDKITGTA